MTPTPQLSLNLLCISFQALELAAGHHFKLYRVPCLKGPYNSNLLGFMALTGDRILLDKDILLCHQTISVKHNNSFTEKCMVLEYTNCGV
jgi:hypothetical protein